MRPCRASATLPFLKNSRHRALASSLGTGLEHPGRKGERPSGCSGGVVGREQGFASAGRKPEESHDRCYGSVGRTPTKSGRIAKDTPLRCVYRVGTGVPLLSSAGCWQVKGKARNERNSWTSSNSRACSVFPTPWLMLTIRASPIALAQRVALNRGM